MEYALTRFQFDRMGVIELFPLFVIQDFTDGVHIAGKASDRE